MQNQGLAPPDPRRCLAGRVTREIGPFVVLTEDRLRATLMRESGVYAKGEAELRGIADRVRLYSTSTALDERSTLRRKSLITDA
jgi:hypothetical protein